ncbi:DUF2061 domain-containing protein [Photobacterium sp. WH77]|uniref:DUF2061 domain-containing protein n=1 Tax=unclassified Photobacterium TaxID=2628852 RepID=UPI001ED9FCF8|nr:MULTISPECIES: DUF2061 domain-containing protein [unclassified Photobacterium]MCG2835357.1 DUF2061 domain-containing protein [Photobacterium sp. WH77]MCG2842970.1 DUF2061 domain-containing protein [Photobacterium sp. WH80]
MKKTLSFAAIHFTVAFSIAYLLTGDVILGSLIAMIEPMVNTVAFYFHEKVWQWPVLKQSRFGKPANKTLSFAVIHFSVAFSVAYLLSGSWMIGGVMALIEPSINTLAYLVHETFWQRKEQRRHQAAFTSCQHHSIIH